MVSRPYHVAIMGDLIGSEHAVSVDSLHATFNDAVDAINSEYRTTLTSPLTITLGDEFQGLCASLSDGLSIVRDLRQRLSAKATPCRFVLGVVTLKTAINHDRAWNMMGPGLATARERLADKRDPNAYRFSLPDHRLVADLLDALGYTVTSIEEGWTARQQQVVTDGRSVAKVAEVFGVTPRNIYKVREAAHFKLYESVWQAMTAAIRALDQDYGVKW